MTCGEQVIGEQYGDWLPSPPRPIENQRTDLREQYPRATVTRLQEITHITLVYSVSYSVLRYSTQSEPPPASNGCPPASYAVPCCGQGTESLFMRSYQGLPSCRTLAVSLVRGKV